MLLVIFSSLYIFGWLFPEPWWSLHFIAFISPLAKAIILFCCGLFLYRFFIPSRRTILDSKIWDYKITWASGLALTYMILMLVFPMIYDFYGDSYRVAPHLNKIPPSIPDGANEAFFDFSLGAWAGQATVFSLVTYVAVFFKLSYKWAFIVFDAFFGGAFVFLWVSFVLKTLKNNVWKIVMVLAGITAPFMLNFFGHTEIYAMLLFMQLWWFTLAFKYLSTEKTSLLIWLFVLLLVCLKVHAINLLLVPGYVILLWKHLKGSSPSWKSAANYILAPIFVIGAILYFFYFEDHIDDRSLRTEAFEYDHLFLPLFSPKPPLDTYDLLSVNHILDYLNAILMWSPIALLVILLISIIKPKKLNWNATAVVFTGTSLILFSSLLFMINPLLSMPIDWDLFSIPSIALLFFSIALVSETEMDLAPKGVINVASVLAMLSIPIVLVHNDQNSLNDRMDTIAVHFYKTYYEGSAKFYDDVLKADPNYEQSRKFRGEEVIRAIAPHSTKLIDYEFGRFLFMQGRYHLRTRKEPKIALDYFERSSKYYELYDVKLLTLEAYFVDRAYDKAYEVSKELITFSYPSEQKAYRASLHCALEAGFYAEAEKIATFYVRNWPEDITVREVYTRLKSKDRVDEIKTLFQRSN
ncbi:hypothetical protein ACFQ1M_08985 [Sungkyunkwania multivorans]|uniref:Glycosyltransferase RgtA/B/C/D-like domain-containing protein n=1 Tax=Sungkyunkwania multivorans TaxID=1173618 RepID=A0ABW3CYD7_9FLAO